MPGSPASVSPFFPTPSIRSTAVMDIAHLTGWSALAITVGAIIFRAGYRMGRDDALSFGEEPERHQETSYTFRGLNFLLSDEPDKAIEAFTNVVRINSETVEIHLSLGNLFRSRGEVGRAIRIHQNLIARPSLSDAYRKAALYALGEDYRQGGFVDRAIDSFRRVLELDPNHRKALAGLQALHENEGRWDIALDILKRLVKVTGEEDPRREAHLLIKIGLEQARTLGEGDDHPGIDWFRKAIRVYPGCVEAFRLLGEAQLSQNKVKGAIQTFATLKKNRPSHFFMLMEPLKRAYIEQGDLGGFEECMRNAVNAPSASPRLIVLWSRELQSRNRTREAVDVLLKGYSKYPGSVVMARLLVRLLGHLNREEEALGVAVRCLDHLLSRQPGFQCSQCGFQSQDIYWKCPQCHRWDAMEPM
ncbi:MAG: tetratricopeptide repeat protein [Magnetococcales bacterium]|nr:tetratricopeptide repeat protein [Magnetococcales bacterium]